MNSMKSKKLKTYGVAVLALALLFIASSLIALHFISQCFADVYWWLTRIPETTGDLFVPAIAVTLVVALPLSAILCLAPLSGKATINGAKALSVIVGLALIAGTAFAITNAADAHNKLEEAKTDAPGAYFGESCFIQESLDGIEEPYDPNSNWLLYVGRSDCKDCKTFEQTWKAHFCDNSEGAAVINPNQTDNPLFVYDTTLDRNGERSQEMKSLLDSWGVTSVPSVVEFKGNTIVKVWNDPTSSIDEIVKRSIEAEEQDSSTK